MSVDVIIEDPRWDGVEAWAEVAVGAALRHLGLSGEVAVLAADDSRIKTLNASFRDKDQPTNVLSWPSSERGAAQPGTPPAPPEDEELGDLAIAYETCAKEADAAGVTLQDHTIHLIVHGTLHLLGYDHVHPEDGDLMEATEIAILATLGVADPYD